MLIDILHFAFLHLSGNFINTYITFKNEEEVQCLTCSCTSCDLCKDDHATGMSNANWVPQSTERVETTTFHDEEKGDSAGWTMGSDALDLGDATQDASLQDFLARPVRIQDYTWNLTDSVGSFASFSPWTNYLSDVRVAKKLANFAYMRGDLHLKVVINGSPFYYGSLRLNYRPLPTFKPDAIDFTSTAAQYLIPTSQQPGLFMRPGRNEGGEFTCPFIWPKTWFSLNLDTADDLGLAYLTRYTVLRSANATVGTSVNVAVYAWLENVELSSSTLLPQSDEYGEGPVSRPASAVANLAANFTSYPVVGKYASATEIGARAVASIAKLFGFTNVPVIDDTRPFAPCIAPNLASTECGYPVSKLTVDAKNELAVVPSATGLGSTDELAIASLVGRESYISSFTWNTSDLPDALLWYGEVSPRQYNATGNTNNSYVDQTPMCLLTNFFQQWRGDIIFRFKVVASPYHKGRIQIFFDPQGNGTTNVTNTAGGTNVLFNEILDIGVCDDIEVRVPYQQAVAYLRTRVNNYYTSPTSSFNSFTAANIGIYSNGYITVRVLNELSAPVATAPVNVLVFVRGADNLEFANPGDPSQYVSYFKAQSDEIVQEPEHQDVITKSTPYVGPERSRLYMGERIMSMRPLLRRYAHVGTYSLAQASALTNYIFTYTHFKLPPAYGFDPNGNGTAKGLVTPANSYNFNWVNPTPLTMLLPCFLYYRGSMNWSVNMVSSGGAPFNQVSVVRTPSQTTENVSWIITDGSFNNINRAAVRYLSAGNTGTTITNQNTQAGLNYAIPNMSGYKFQSTAVGNNTAPPLTTSPRLYDGSLFDGVTLAIEDLTITARSSMKRYAGIGTDFNMHYFVCVPTMYTYTGTPNSP